MRQTTILTPEVAEFWQGCSDLASVLEEVSRYGTAPGLEAAYGLVRDKLMRSYPKVADHVRSGFPPPTSPRTRGSQDFIDTLLSSPTASAAVNRLGGDLQRALGFLRATSAADTAH